MSSTHRLWPRPTTLRRFSPLQADLQVDVAIVGGGVTGLTAAVLLAEAGKRVAVLESRELGAGVTGASTAHLTEAVDTRYHELESKFGRDAARLVRASSREAIETIAALSEKSQSGFQRVTGYLFTNDEQQLAELDAELLAAERAGASVERSEVPLPMSIRGGISFANQAQIQPLAHLATLSERLSHTTARVFEGVSMLDIDGGGPLRITTDVGPRVTADSVVLATHAPFAKLSLQLKLSQYRSYVLAGPGIGVVPGLCWDMQDPYHYVRSATIDGRTYTLVGGGDHRTGQTPEGGPDAPYRELEGFAARCGVHAETRWSAQVVESADGLPFIGRPHPDEPLYLATGFGGNGMTFGTLAAMLISDAILGRKNHYAELYRANRLGPISELGSVMSENLSTAAHLVADHLKPAASEPLAELPIGVGRIVKDKGERLAAYRDHDGKLHTLSCICTHQGCQVAFNPLERSWDCPCHGSRFDIDGRVLDGPATRPLEPRPR